MVAMFLKRRQQSRLHHHDDQRGGNKDGVRLQKGNFIREHAQVKPTPGHTSAFGFKRPSSLHLGGGGRKRRKGSLKRQKGVLTRSRFGISC